MCKSFVLSVLIMILLMVPTTTLYEIGATPYSGQEPTPTNLLLYLHNSSSGLAVGSVEYLNVLTTQNDTSPSWKNTGELIVGLHYLFESFVIYPQLSGPLIINGTIKASIYMNQTGSSLTGGSTTIYVFSVTPSGNKTLLGYASNPNSLIPAGSQPTGTPVELEGPTVNYTVPSGNTVMIQLNITGTSSSHYGIWWGYVDHSYYESTISLPVSSYLNIPSIEVKNYLNQNVTVLPFGIKNTTVTVYAEVVDPLGTYDFSSYPVYFSVKNYTGSIIFTTVMSPMNPLSPAYAFSQIYWAKFNYSNLPSGEYQFFVNATDNTYHNLYGVDTLPNYYGRLAQQDLTVVIGQPPVPVNIQILDRMNRTLNGAVIMIYEAGNLVNSNITNSSGFASFLLSNDSKYMVRVYWENVNVGEFNISIYNSTNSFVFTVNVIYPKFQLVSTAGIPLEYSLVLIVQPNGSSLPLTVSNSSGMFNLSQVPSGTFMLTVIFDDTVVASSEAVNALNDSTVIVTIQDVYSFTIKSETSTGAPLNGVFVQVRNSTTGAIIESGVTNSSGQLIFLVPTGTYSIQASWKTTYDFTNLQQNLTTNVTISGPSQKVLVFSKAYPPIFSTVLFDFILVIVLLLAVIIVLTLMMTRRRSGRSKVEN